MHVLDVSLVQKKTVTANKLDLPSTADGIEGNLQLQHVRELISGKHFGTDSKQVSGAALLSHGSFGKIFLPPQFGARGVLAGKGETASKSFTFEWMFYNRITPEVRD